MESEFDTFCKFHNILIFYDSKLTTKCKGLCYYDGIYYNVFINAKHSYHQNIKTLVHELLHIINNHFSCEPLYLEQCEKETEIIINELNDLLLVY